MLRERRGGAGARCGNGKGAAGALRVALSPTIGIELVLAALREASKLFDGLELVVRRESAAGTLDLLKTGEVEVAISAGDDLEARPWLERFPLFDEGFLLISAREHRLANSASFGLDDLREERIALPRHAEHGDALAASAPGKGRHDAWSDADVAAVGRRRPGRRDRPAKLPAVGDRLRRVRIEGLDLKRTVSAFVAAGRPRSAPATMLINLSARRRLGRSDRLIRRERRPAWIYGHALAIIGINETLPDHAVLSHHEGRRNRNHPGFVSLKFGEVGCRPPT